MLKTDGCALSPKTATPTSSGPAKRPKRSLGEEHDFE